MKKTLIRILPALLIGVSLIISALILEKGMSNLARGLYDISYSVEEAASSAISVDVMGSLEVGGLLDIDGSITTY